MNKLVSDLIGGDIPSVSPVPPKQVPKKTPEKEPTKQVQITTPPSRIKPVKLVIDQLAPVNIRAKVNKVQVTCSLELGE